MKPEIVDKRTKSSIKKTVELVSPNELALNVLFKRPDVAVVAINLKVKSAEKKI